MVIDWSKAWVGACYGLDGGLLYGPVLRLVYLSGQEVLRAGEQSWCGPNEELHVAWGTYIFRFAGAYKHFSQTFLHGQSGVGGGGGPKRQTKQ